MAKPGILFFVSRDRKIAVIGLGYARLLVTAAFGCWNPLPDPCTFEEDCGAALEPSDAVIMAVAHDAHIKGG